MIETLRSYVQLATGLIESTSERAKDAAGALVTSGLEVGSKGPEVVSGQVQEIADDLLEQGRTNRELMIGLIRTEVERAVGRMGFVREEELAAVRRHVERLEEQVNTRGDQATAAASMAVATATAAVPAASRAASRAAGATRQVAAKAASVRTGSTPAETDSSSPSQAASKAATAVPAKKPQANTSTAKKATAKKATAKKATRKAPAKPTAKQSPTKKTTEDGS